MMCLVPPRAPKHNPNEDALGISVAEPRVFGRWTNNAIFRGIAVSTDLCHVLPHDKAATEATIHGTTVENDGVFNVVTGEKESGVEASKPRQQLSMSNNSAPGTLHEHPHVPGVAHNGNDSVLTTRQLVKVDQVEDMGAHHGLVGVHHGVQHRVHALVLVHGHCTNGLLAHGTLVRVTRGLVVVGVRNQPRNNTQNGERVNFDMGRAWNNARVVQRHQTIVFLVHIDILDAVLGEEGVEVAQAIFQVFQVLSLHSIITGTWCKCEALAHTTTRMMEAHPARTVTRGCMV